MTVLVRSPLCVASTDTAGDETVAAGMLHAFCPGDFTMTLCGLPLVGLHRWEANWTGHPAGNSCRRCLTATLRRAQAAPAREH
jgi:hypothetical protein